MQLVKSISYDNRCRNVSRVKEVKDVEIVDDNGAQAREIPVEASRLSKCEHMFLND